MYVQGPSCGTVPLPRRFLLEQMLKRATLTRVALNWWVREYVHPRGRVCDVGGGREPSYAQFVGSRVGWIIVDLNPQVQPTVVAELQRLPFPCGVFDTVCCFNVLEHIYEAQMCAEEMFRMLAPGGRLYLFVPFLIGIHADPHDYHRYTGAALERLFRDAGFEQVEVFSFFGFFSALFNLGRPIFPCRYVRALIGLGFAAADTVLYRLKPGLVEKHVLAYAVRAVKSERGSA